VQVRNLRCLCGGQLAPKSGRARRSPTYSDDLVTALGFIWRIARYPTGKRLAPMLPVLVPSLRRDGELVMGDAEAELLISMSPSTIDRRLLPARRLRMPRGRSHTKPGILLKSQIPIRTWSEWDDARPGFVEVDCQRPLGIPHRRPGEFHADGHRSTLRDGHGKSPRTAASSPRGRPRELPADDWQTGSAVEGHDPLS
jgi:hypothetical protein